MRSLEVGPVTDSDLQALVVDTMANHPEESLEQVLIRLRVRMGRTIDDAEIERLRETYQREGAGILSAGIAATEAARVSDEASLSHFRPNANEITALVAAVLPFFVHVGSTTVKQNVSSYFDLFATAAGLIAIGSGIGAFMLVRQATQRPLHFALIGVVVVLGVYQVLLGLGLLHRIGLIQYS
jgi:hypothetical protein